MNKLISNFKSKQSTKIKNLKNYLGGKGTNLREMGKLGLQVPPGFTISTKVCDIFYKNKKNIPLIRSLSFHGWSNDPWTRHLSGPGKKHWYYEIKNLGFKYNMNNLLASIGISQLKKLNSLNRKRIIILKKYLSGIKNCKNISLAFPYKLEKSSYYFFSVAPDKAPPRQSHELKRLIIYYSKK